ncbi:MAG: hypothetical protein GX787_07830 [Tissierellia bacterium]|nr:hypothetical protein [Tissierellia bacterium]
MDKNFKWYTIIAISAVLLIVYAGYFFINMSIELEDDFTIIEEPLNKPIDNNQKENGNKLPIPPLLEDKNPEEGKADFV